MTQSLDEEFKDVISRFDAEQLALFSVRVTTVELKDVIFDGKMDAYAKYKRRELGHRVYPDYETLSRLNTIVTDFEKKAWGRLYYCAALRGDAEAVDKLNSLVVRRLSH